MMPGHLAAASIVLLLAACASSPSTLYLTLEAPSVPATVQTHHRAIVVGPISVPEVVDRPQVMLRVGPNRLEAAANMRWAQPFKLEVARALAAHLAQLLANPLVVPATAAVPVEPFIRITADILAVDIREGESIVLEVLWVIRESGTGKLLASQRNVLRETVTGKGGEALAAAQSRALARLAAELAQALN